MKGALSISYFSVIIAFMSERNTSIKNNKGIHNKIGSFFMPNKHFFIIYKDNSLLISVDLLSVLINQWVLLIRVAFIKVGRPLRRINPTGKDSYTLSLC